MPPTAHDTKNPREDTKKIHAHTHTHTHTHNEITEREPHRRIGALASRERTAVDERLLRCAGAPGRRLVPQVGRATGVWEPLTSHLSPLTHRVGESTSARA